MAAKFLHSFIDENQDLQIGCMNGMFHKFERQHMLRNTTKRLPPRPGKAFLCGSWFRKVIKTVHLPFVIFWFDLITTIAILNGCCLCDAC